MSENPDARGVNVLFKLPLDAADADKTKAEELLKQWVGDDADNWEYDAEAAAAHKEQYQNIIREGKMQEHKLLEQTADGSWYTAGIGIFAHISRCFIIQKCSIADRKLIRPAGALAAWQLLSPAQIAHELQNNALEKAFASEEALFINQSVQSGGYRITLLGLVSGAVCSEYVPSDVELGQDRLYAAVAIENADGSPMPDTASEEYPSFSLSFLFGFVPRVQDLFFPPANSGAINHPVFRHFSFHDTSNFSFNTFLALYNLLFTVPVGIRSKLAISSIESPTV